MNERIRKFMHERRGFRKLQAEEIFLKSGFVQVEAFALMTYVGHDPSGLVVTEVLWNSRDGVTPFCINDRHGRFELQHEHWSEDLCCPLHVPMIGDRVFVDMSVERAMEMAVQRVERGWNEDHGGYRMSDTFESRDDAVKKLTASFLGPKDGDRYTSPDILVVDEALQEKFINQRRGALGAIGMLRNK